MNRMLLLTVLICLFTFSRPGASEEEKGAAGSVHVSSARTDPETTDESQANSFWIDRDGIESVEWRAAIKAAQSHQSNKGHYSLFRVQIVDGGENESIQVGALKLKELTEKYDGGGGTYRVYPGRGGFVFIEHINSSSRNKGRDPVVIGAGPHGTTKFWIDVPPEGVLGVLGDVTLSRAADEKTGILWIRVETDVPVAKMKAQIGNLVTGGPYGQTHVFDSTVGLRLRLPPGDYKLLLPQFDLKNSRWSVKILPKQITRIVFKIDGQRVEKAEEKQIQYRQRGDSSATTVEEKSSHSGP